LEQFKLSPQQFWLAKATTTKYLAEATDSFFPGKAGNAAPQVYNAVCATFKTYSVELTK